MFPGNFESQQKAEQEEAERQPRRQQIWHRFLRNAKHKISLMETEGDESQAVDEIKALQRKFLNLCDDVFPERRSVNNSKCKSKIKAKARKAKGDPVERRAEELEKRAEKKEKNRETKSDRARDLAKPIKDAFEFDLNLKIGPERLFRRKTVAELRELVTTLKDLKKKAIKRCQKVVVDGNSHVCAGKIASEAKKVSNPLQKALREAIRDEDDK